jgi:hypothetical protein
MEQTFEAFHETAVGAPAGESGRESSAPAPRRYDLYAIIHKAMRAAMADAMLAAGRLDAADAREITDTVARVDALIELCRLHLEKENAYVHPAMEARMPGSTRRIANEHVDHEAALARLRRHLDALTRAPASTRETVAHELYLELSLFVGENLVHMHEEETAHNAVLWDCYTDSEIAAIELQIRSHLTPSQMQHALRWMLPAMTPSQRTGMMKEARSTAPAPAYGGMLAAARAYLDANGFQKLESALAA